MKKYIYIIGCFLLFASCSDFLKERSMELAYASSCRDLSELLIGSGYMTGVPNNLVAMPSDHKYFPFIHVMDDDCEQFLYGSKIDGPFAYWQGFYRWEQHPFNNGGSPYSDATWAKLYAHIATANTVIALADTFEEDPEELRNQVKGEAYFLRGAYYFLLANLYANPYSKATKHDPGVPVKTTEYIQDMYYHRHRLDSVYGVILHDLLQAKKYLKGITQKTVYRANEFAASALLSRFYLYTANWKAAIRECDYVINQGKYQVLDMEEYINSKDTNFLDANSVETVFSQGNALSTTLITLRPSSNKPRVSTFQVSPELLELYDEEKDLRRSVFFETVVRPARTTVRKTRNKSTEISDIFLIRYPEVILNKAEAMAMLDKPAAEIEKVLNMLRSKRYKNGETEKITATGQELANLIRDERRRELCFEGHRWFDLRRYAVSPRYPYKKEIKHTSYAVSGPNQDGDIEGYYLLKPFPEDKGWVLPIPEYAITFNNGEMVANERPERKLIH